MFSELLDRIFNRDAKVTPRAQAKDRLKMVLAYDRTDISPQLMEKMRAEILVVMGRYFDIEADELEVLLDREGNTTALIANVPIRRVKVNDNE